MPIPFFTALLLALYAGLAAHTASAEPAPPARQAEVAARGAQVMPFELAATSHIFTKNRNGGLQQVLVRNPKDKEQLRLVRSHLQEIAGRFQAGDFSAPARIHGEAMPGLAQLKQARPGEITLHYKEVRDGAQIRYATSNPALVPALHQWFDAQLSDHGADAREGHAHHHGHQAHQAPRQ
ncbi:aspartate carbamoyltransferase|uniref:aspartate carbamoyltransferase n=1 Tax=Noviherbaspirillum sp. L7-7A TaxID=2850560 RepID=UPI001C2BA0DC|nr:aspartate carbamoyltransferase [Noviherbaspirillum sp. L7-7A]MBV0880931.1 aspartate carbamoyltransferase [Noviherbaspirillum sp. L7-7A]